MNYNIILFGIIFIIGMFFYCSKRSKSKENFDNNNDLSASSNNSSQKPTPIGNNIPEKNCPNYLMKRDGKYILYNSNLAKVPGINPVIFNTLEDYAEFVEWQNSQNISCPVLFLESSYNSQNEQVYSIKDDPLLRNTPFIHPNLTLNLISSRVNANKEHNLSDSNIPNPKNDWTTPLNNAGTNYPPYNQNSYSGFDPNDQYIGDITPLDKMFNSNNRISANPMDTNWGGHQYTLNKIKEGSFSEDEVFKNTSN